MARRRYQKGRVFLRGKNPRWIGRWREDIVVTDGQVKRVERSQVLGTKTELPTKKLAQRRLDLLLAKVNAPSYRPGRVATLAEFAERWRADVLSQFKPSTISSAQSNLRRYILPQLGPLALDQVGRECQQALITRLSQTLSRRTVLNAVCTLASVLSTAQKWGYICEPINWSHLTLPPHSVRRPARFFNAEQTAAIIAAAEEPFATMFAVLAMTAIRAGELAGLHVDDLDFDRRLIHIQRSVWGGRAQTTKSASSTKSLPMPDYLAEVLSRYLATYSPTSWLFANRRGYPFDTGKIVERKLWPILDRLGIPRCGLHAFRHTHSSLLLETGAPATVAQAQLRHSNASITLGIYSHIIGDAHRRAVEKVAELLRPNAPNSKQVAERIQ